MSPLSSQVCYPAVERPRDAEHVMIYYDPAHFAGWPFNHGFWAFEEDELVVGFSRGASHYEVPFDTSHQVVDALNGEYVVLRSTDGGQSWPLDTLQILGSRIDLERQLLGGVGPTAPPQPLDWQSPDFCLTAGFGIPPKSAPHVGYIQISHDRGHHWEGPYPIPTLGFDWVQVKPDYLVRPDGVVLLFVTVAKQSSRFVAVYATPDGGLTWHYLGPILADSPDRSFVNRYYASPVLLPDGRMVAALRCQIDARNAWPELFASDDGGRRWHFVARVSDWGGPTHLTRLRDGRLLAVYGYRVKPYGIRARLSEDKGRHWGPELVLRDDGGSWDLGYPRTVQLRDGRVMVAYYFNRANDPIQCNGGVRHIAGTIFKP